MESLCLRCMPVLILIACIFLAVPAFGAPESGLSLDNSAGDSTGRIWKQVSDDAPFGLRSSFPLVEFNGNMWIVGGSNPMSKYNDVWFSRDGASWTQATGSAQFSPRYQHAVLAFKSKLWVIGGKSAQGKMNDVWYSADGITWTEATPHAEFPARFQHTAVVFHDKMWVIGGHGNENNPRPFDGDAFNDVWYSSDGITWMQATPHAAFSPRYSHVSFVFNDSIWVVGSYHDDEHWRSPDGVNWTLAANRPYTFAPKDSEQPPIFLVYDSMVWRISAFTNGYPRQSDVWYSRDGINWASHGQFFYPGSQSNINSYIRAGVVHDNRIFVINEYGNRSLTETTFLGISLGTSYQYNNRYMVWYSAPDAATYTNLELHPGELATVRKIEILDRIFPFLKR